MKAPTEGVSIPSVTHGPITIERLKLYAEASGDYNPIHTDETAAKSAGLPGIIAHGMLSAGFLSDLAARFMKPWDALWKLAEFQTRFKSMTFLGDTVQVSGTVKSVTPEMVCLELIAKNGRGELTTQAFAEFRPRT